MWDVLRKVVAVACVLLSERDEKEKKKLIKKLIMDLWDKVDPTPEFDLDDKVVEVIIDWFVSVAIDDLKMCSEISSPS
jgi:hypothetical protein